MPQASHKQQLIESLQLEPHCEGGYFRRSYESELSTTTDSGDRLLMSSIFYLLTDDSPIGYFHRNQSDIVHYWHGGASLRYYLIDQTGHLQSPVLGPNLAAGEQLQMTVAGGIWKATQLVGGEYGLLSEAVCPGFDYGDMQLATTALLEATFPTLWQTQRELLSGLCRN